MARPLVYVADVLDAETQLPVAVIDASAMQQSGRLPTAEEEVPELLNSFPKSEFVVVFFASRFPKTPQINWLRKVHGQLSRGLKKRIQRVYVVHAKWITRTLNKALTPIVSPKFASKIVFLRNLGELSHYMDITAIDINPRVYCDDLDRSGSGAPYGLIPVPKRTASIFGTPLTPKPNSYWRAALTFLNNAEISSNTFLPMSRMTEEEEDLVHILKHAVAREQTLRLYDYGPMVVLTVLKEYLLSLPEPLVSIRLIELPLEDTNSYAERVLSEVPNTHLKHLDDLITFSSTLLGDIDSKTIARSLGPAVMRLRQPRRETVAISVRFFRNLLEHWSELELLVDDAADLESRDLTVTERARRTKRHDDLVELENELSELRLQEAAPQKLNRLNNTTSLLMTPEPEEEDFFKGDTAKEQGPMPRESPSKVPLTSQRPPRIPNRRAFGKVAEIMKLYDENHLI